MKLRYKAPGIRLFEGDGLRWREAVDRADVVFTDPPVEVARADFDPWAAAPEVHMLLSVTAVAGWTQARTPAFINVWPREEPTKFGHRWDAFVHWGLLWIEGYSAPAVPAATDHPAERELGAWGIYLAGATAEFRHRGESALVLDPFAGVGTTLVAARGLGLAAVGIERDPHWCDLAVARLEGRL